MRIGDVAARAGVSTRALRYYEEQGLLASERTTSGQRTYAESAVERVRMIQQFFAAGLASRTILQLLPCVDTGHASSDVFEMLAAERDRITGSMAELAAARDALDRMIEIAHDPSPEHCPALRHPAWSPYVPGRDVPELRAPGRDARGLDAPDDVVGDGPSFSDVEALTVGALAVDR